MNLQSSTLSYPPSLSPSTAELDKPLTEPSTSQLIDPVQTAIENYTIPPYLAEQGYEKVKMDKGASSMIFTWGVGLRHQIRKDKRQWICMAGPRCREMKKIRSCGKANTSNQLKHLRLAHSITAKRLDTYEDMKKRMDEDEVYVKQGHDRKPKHSRKASVLQGDDELSPSLKKVKQWTEEQQREYNELTRRQLELKQEEIQQRQRHHEERIETELANARRSTKTNVMIAALNNGITDQAELKRLLSLIEN